MPGRQAAGGSGDGPAVKGDRTIATNRRARHDYAIEETYEAGMILTGPEVKSLRAGRATIADAYARVVGEEVWVENLHIPPYEMADQRSYQPVRRRFEPESIPLWSRRSDARARSNVSSGRGFQARSRRRAARPRSISRRCSRSAMASRFSYFRLPRPSPSSIFASPRVK